MSSTDLKPGQRLVIRDSAAPERSLRLYIWAEKESAPSPPKTGEPETATESFDVLTIRGPDGVKAYRADVLDLTAPRGDIHRLPSGATLTGLSVDLPPGLTLRSLAPSPIRSALLQLRPNLLALNELVRRIHLCQRLCNKSDLDPGSPRYIPQADVDVVRAIAHTWGVRFAGPYGDLKKEDASLRQRQRELRTEMLLDLGLRPASRQPSWLDRSRSRRIGGHGNHVHPITAEQLDRVALGTLLHDFDGRRVVVGLDPVDPTIDPRTQTLRVGYLAP